MLRHIQTCTIFEARSQLEDNVWTMSMEKLHAFLATIYARGALGAKGIAAENLWDITWGPVFFHETMSRNRFQKIMRYLRFDMQSTRSQRLPTDKFGLVSDP